MNKIYRTVWSESRQSYVVAHEKAAPRGKPSSTRKAIVSVVAAALVALAGEGMASSCGNPGTTVIPGAETDRCILVNGESLSVTGSIVNSSVGLGEVGVYVGAGVSTAGSIHNDGGTIAGMSGVNVAGPSAILTGGLTNSGSISGLGAVIVDLGGQLQSGLTNSGTIAGVNIGIFLSGSSTLSGNLINAASGNITASTGTAIVLQAGSRLTGSVINEGTISAPASLAIALRGGSQIDNGITNSAQITASHGIFVMSNSTLSGGVTNDGTITGFSVGINFSSQSTLAGGLTNTVSVSGDDRGINISDSSQIDYISNAANAYIGASLIAIYLANSSTIAAGITNAGTISGLNGNAVKVIGNSTVTDGITNNGTISSFNSEGILVTDGSTVAGVTNTGLISGHRVGMQIDDATVGPIINTTRVSSGTTYVGTISGDEGGITISNSAVVHSITNSGRISYSASSNNTFGAIYVGNATVSGAINNSGTISGLNTSSSYALGLWLEGATVGSITNSGTISAENTYNADSAVGIWIKYGSSISAGITNSGLISGGYGLEIDSSTLVGGIHNDGGRIIGTASSGLLVAFSSTVSGGISNSGTISGGTHGIVVVGSTISDGIFNNGATSTISGASGAGLRITSTSAVTGGLTNSGTISGGTKAIYVDGSSSLDNIVIAGNDTAKFIGEVFAEDTPVTVASGATYTMDDGQLFTLTNSSFTNAGTLKVGAGNTGTITGDFVNTGTFSSTITDTAAGRLVVSGTANLGGQLAVDASLMTGGHSHGSSIAGVVSAGAVNGTFAGYSDNSALFDFTPTYTATTVDLTIVAAGSGGGGGGGSTGVLAATEATGNNPAAGAARVFDDLIDGFIANGTTGNPEMDAIIGTLGAMSTQQEVSDAVSQVLPLLTGSATVAMTSAMQGLNRVVQARQEGQHGRSTGDEFFGDRRFWMKPFGSWADQDNRKGVPGYESDTYGLVFGADAEFGEVNRIGVGFSYANSDVDGNSGVAPNSADVDSYQLVLYGSRSFSSATEISYQADVGFHQTDGRRSVSLLLPGQVAKSDYDSWSGHLGVGLAHTFDVSEQTSLTPGVRLDYTRVDSESYTEKGAGALNLEVDDTTAEELIVSLDAKLAHKLTERATITANLGVGYDMINEESAITSSFAGTASTAFVTHGLAPDAWSYRGGLGVVGNVTDAVEVTARYDFERKEDFDNQTASVKVRWAF